MDKYIRVKNCNCISDATIEIVEKSLNIKSDCRQSSFL